MRKLKKASGEIISVNEILEKKPLKVKNFGLWLRYDSRSGTHNMYKEYRAMSRVEAVEQMYSDMAARHRSRFRSVHILKVVELEKTSDVKRPYIKQLLEPKLRFPLPSRLPKQAVSTFDACFMQILTIHRVPERRSSLLQGHPPGTKQNSCDGLGWSRTLHLCRDSQRMSHFLAIYGIQFIMHTISHRAIESLRESLITYLPMITPGRSSKSPLCVMRIVVLLVLIAKRLLLKSDHCVILTALFVTMRAVHSVIFSICD